MIDKATRDRRRRRNVRLALIIAGVALLFYVTMFVTMSQGQ